MTPQAVGQWLKLLETAPEVQAEVQAGTLTSTQAVKLAAKSKKEQVEIVTKAKATAAEKEAKQKQIEATKREREANARQAAATAGRSKTAGKSSKELEKAAAAKPPKKAPKAPKLEIPAEGDREVPRKELKALLSKLDLDAARFGGEDTNEARKVLRFVLTGKGHLRLESALGKLRNGEVGGTPEALPVEPNGVEAEATV